MNCLKQSWLTLAVFFFKTDFNSAYHLPKPHVDYLEKKKMKDRIVLLEVRASLNLTPR